MLDHCISKNCYSVPSSPDSKFCKNCSDRIQSIYPMPEPVSIQQQARELHAKMIPPKPQEEKTPVPEGRRAADKDFSMAMVYPKYYKAIPAGMREIDVYAVCMLFPVADDTGCINHARKKLLVPGTRTGGKSFYDDVKEARDTLNRWLELNNASAPTVTKQSLDQLRHR